MKYWLMKSEPLCFSFEDLKDCHNSTDHWDGVRNYQARNMMRDDMSVGDQVFFYRMFTDIGTWAEEITIKASVVAKKPNNIVIIFVFIIQIQNSITLTGERLMWFS